MRADSRLSLERSGRRRDQQGYRLVGGDLTGGPKTPDDLGELDDALTVAIRPLLARRAAMPCVASCRDELETARLALVDTLGGHSAGPEGTREARGGSAGSSADREGSPREPLVRTMRRARRG
jgi:hypothetical protein